MTDPLRTAQYPAVRVVCAGVVRSGSMWAFNVVRRLLELAPPERHVSWEWAEGTELDAAVWRTLGSDHHVIKCHEESGGFLSALDAQFVNGIVFSLRDPMASLASCMEPFVNREPFSHHWNFETALGHIEGGLRLARRVAGRQEVLFVDTPTTSTRARAVIGVVSSPPSRSPRPPSASPPTPTSCPRGPTRPGFAGTSSPAPSLRPDRDNSPPKPWASP